jgi:hypothetical protein
MVTESPFLLWTVGVLAGSMLFFAAVVAPKVFQTLQPDQAGLFLRSFFPAYYLWGTVVAIAAAVIAIWTGAGAVVACSAVALLFVYAGWILMPRINDARDAQQRGEDGAGQRFKRMHLQSVVINATQLLILLAVAALLFRSA